MLEKYLADSLTCPLSHCTSLLQAGLNLSVLSIPSEAALELSNLSPFLRNYLPPLFRLKNSMHTHVQLREFSKQAQQQAGLSTACRALPTLPNPHLLTE